MSVDDFEAWKIMAECIKNKVISQKAIDHIFEEDPLFLEWYLKNYCNEPNFNEQ